MCTHTKPNYLVKIIKAHHATLPTQPRGRMNKKRGRAAQSFSCHLTSAQKSHMHPSPIHATSFLPIFHISVIAGFSTEHLFQNKCTKSRRVRSVCKGCLREYPPSFPPSPHAYFQTNDLSLSRCVSQLSEGDWGWGWGTHSFVSTLYISSFFCLPWAMQNMYTIILYLFSSY